MHHQNSICFDKKVVHVAKVCGEIPNVMSNVYYSDE